MWGIWPGRPPQSVVWFDSYSIPRSWGICREASSVNHSLLEYVEVENVSKGPGPIPDLCCGRTFPWCFFKEVTVPSGVGGVWEEHWDEGPAVALVRAIRRAAQDNRTGCGRTVRQAVCSLLKGPLGSKRRDEKCWSEHVSFQLSQDKRRGESGAFHLFEV